MTEQRKVLDIARLKFSCRTCSVRRLCLPYGLDASELERLESLISRPRPLRRGQHLYRLGDAQRSVYAVKSGSLKVYRAMANGDEQIVGFHLPGELVGLEALGNEAHGYSAVALETTSVCEVSLARLDEVCAKTPRLQHQLNRLIGKQVSDDHAMLLLLGRKSAEGRLASFLLSLSQRFKARGYSPDQFSLSMTRHDIGNYLGLAVETVSRLFTRMQGEGLINVENRRVQLVDRDALAALTQNGQAAAQKSGGRRRGDSVGRQQPA